MVALCCSTEGLNVPVSSTGLVCRKEGLADSAVCVFLALRLRWHATSPVAGHLSAVNPPWTDAALVDAVIRRLSMLGSRARYGFWTLCTTLWNPGHPRLRRSGP
jgi:hypothetical protein